MKTLTEFSPLLLRNAAAARATAPKNGSAPPVATDAPGSEAAASSGDATAEPAAETAPAEAETPAAEAPAEAADAGEAPAEAAAPAETTPAPKDPAIEVVAAKLGVQADRAERLLEALDIVGNRIDEVRLVRVFQGEKGPPGSVQRGEFHYSIDRVTGGGGRRDRGDRGGRGGDRGERRGRGGPGGGGGGGGFGGGRDRDKPRGLGSLKVGAKEEKKEDDRPGRGEMPRAGIGWQLTAAPRDFGDRGRGGPGGRGRGPKRGRGGPGGGGDRPDHPGRGRGPRDDRGGHRGRGPRDNNEPRAQAGEPRVGADNQPLPPNQHQQQVRPPSQPRLGPDGQPLPPRSKRPRKPIGPDANGLGPDGTPWDPERRAKRLAERQPAVNSAEGSAVETQTPSTPAPSVENQSESSGK